MTPFLQLPGTCQVVISGAGVPGAGKTTVMMALADSLDATLLSSSDVRQSLGLDDPLEEKYRRILQTELRAQLSALLQQGSRVVVVDTNLLEEKARSVLYDNLPNEPLRVFCAVHVSTAVAASRIDDKFGKKYMYVPGRFSRNDVLDHSILVGDPVTADESRARFDVVFRVETDTGSVQSHIQSQDAESVHDSLRDVLVLQQTEESGVSTRNNHAALSLAPDSEKWLWNPESDGLVVRRPERAVSYHRRRELMLGLRDIAASEGRPALDDFSGSYLGRLRHLVGSHPLIVPSVRLVVRNREGRVLLIRRRDTDEWALVGGSCELEESLVETAIRELREETGIEAIDSLRLVAIHSGARQVSSDRFGHVNQGLSHVFDVRVPGEDLDLPTLEVVEGRWVHHDNVNSLRPGHRASLYAVIQDSPAGVKLVD